jgi:hypothetical protein
MIYNRQLTNAELLQKKCVVWTIALFFKKKTCIENLNCSHAFKTNYFHDYAWCRWSDFIVRQNIFDE